MIQQFVHFTRCQRFITVTLPLPLTPGAIVVFHPLPVEASPDVMGLEMDVITLGPGHA